MPEFPGNNPNNFNPNNFNSGSIGNLLGNHQQGQHNLPMGHGQMNPNQHGQMNPNQHGQMNPNQQDLMNQDPNNFNSQARPGLGSEKSILENNFISNQHMIMNQKMLANNLNAQRKNLIKNAMLQGKPDQTHTSKESEGSNFGG